MSKLVLSFKHGKQFQQIHVGEGYTFDFSNLFVAHVKNARNERIKVSLVLQQPFPVVEEDDPRYIKGFHSTANTKACDKAVPPGTTVVVIEGNVMEHAVAFHGKGGLTIVRNGGKTRIISDQPGIAIGDNATVVNINFPKP